MTPRSKHIFIVEDNEVYAMLLDYILSKDSIYQFVSFKTGEECLANLHLNPDIIILDYGLPGMNGLDTLKEIKNRNKNIHVVILTSHSEKALEKELLSAGADDVVMKEGHGEQQIIDKIEKILQKDAERKHLEPVGRTVGKSILYFLLILLLLTLGVFFTQKIRERRLEPPQSSFVFSEKKEVHHV